MSSRVAAGIHNVLKQVTFCPQRLSVRHAGHAHWQNVKKDKDAGDFVKGYNGTMLSIRIRQALATGSPDPKTNANLAKAMKFADDNNIPSKSVKSMIAKAWDRQQNKVSLKIEARGPSGSLLILNMIAEPTLKSRTRNLVNKYLVKYARGQVLEGVGGTAMYFTDKGVITTVSSCSDMTFEEAEEIAISVDAEDIDIVKDSNPTNYQLICDPEALYTVVENLSDTKLTVEDFQIEPVPNERVDLTEGEKADLDKAMKFIREYPELGLESVYDNINW